MFTALRVFAIVAAILIATGIATTDALAFAPTSYAVDYSLTVAMAIGVVGVQRVIRLNELPLYLGLRKSQIAEAIKKGWLHPFSPLPGSRAKVVTEAEVIALQQKAMAEAAEAAAAAATAPVKELAPNRKRRLAHEAAEHTETTA
jgi:hypothetical protein